MLIKYENKKPNIQKLMVLILLVCQQLTTATSNATTILSTATANGTVKPLKDDLTSAFAKSIIRQAKAADIKSLLNIKVSPCVDFYEYACGNWPRQNPAQLLNNIVTDRFQAIGKAFKRRLETLLNAPLTNDKLENNVKDFYRSCQLAKHDDIHYKLGLENVWREFGTLPMLEGADWNETDFNWWQTVANIQHKYGKEIILALSIMGDIQNNSQSKIYLGPPDYQGSSNTQILRVLQEAATVKNLQSFIGLEHSAAKQAAKELIAFESILMQGGVNGERSKSLQDLLSLQSVTELNDTYAEHIDVAEFLELLLGTEPPEEIYIYNEEYLMHVLQTIAQTPKRTVANYIYWQLLQVYFIDAAPADLNKWCLDKTKKYFGKYIQQLVYQSYKTEAATKEVHELWTEINLTFQEELAGDKLDWISNSTRTYAIEKLKAMQLLISSYEDEDFASEYGQLQMDRLSYVQNLQQVLQHTSAKKLQRLQQPGQSLEETEVFSYTPAYNIVENVIRMPVSILQPRFLWDTNYPQALKYATLGYLMAHEMIHGFDDEGRNYDKEGNLHSWWDAKSLYEYEARRKCFQAQYHGYSYGGKMLPESVMQSENIADNAAVKFAYKAYARWLDKQRQKNVDIEKQETLPGLGLNNRQLFFTSFAQVWCGDVQSLFKSTFAADVHAPGMYRVIGTLSNFQEFSWVFECPQNAPMDPEFKCAIY